MFLSHPSRSVPPGPEIISELNCICCRMDSGGEHDIFLLMSLSNAGPPIHIFVLFRLQE